MVRHSGRKIQYFTHGKSIIVEYFHPHMDALLPPRLA